MWNSPESIKDLLNMGKLKMNYEDYWKLYNIQTKFIPLWEFNHLTGNKEVTELKSLEFVRTKLHGKMTDDILRVNNLSQSEYGYANVRRAIALLIEDDYRIIKGDEQ